MCGESWNREFSQNGTRLIPVGTVGQIGSGFVSKKVKVVSVVKMSVWSLVTGTMDHQGTDLLCDLFEPHFGPKVWLFGH